MLNIEPPLTSRYAFLHTGFRPFFAAASLGSAVLMLLWMGIFTRGWWATPPDFPMITWHAYEMTFGFGVAVVTGFLLTAVKNWTSLKTLDGYPLLGLALLWLLARLLPFLPFGGVNAALLAELGFLLWLGVVITRPIVRTRQWSQMAVIAKVFLLVPALGLVALGLNGIWGPGIGVGLYSGLYLLLGLVLTLGRRVMPMFIERGLNNGFLTRNHAQVDRWCLILFVVFAVNGVWLQASSNEFLSNTLGVLAVLLAGLHSWRLYGWYHPGIWQKPLLWSLVLGYSFIILGFVLQAATRVLVLNPSVALHAFTVGGLGLVTLGMMARVSLGHTGRNVNAPPQFLKPIFVVAAMAAFSRSLGVAVFPVYYGFWILISQGLWITAFGLFSAAYLPIWIYPRLDGGRG